MRAQPPGTSPGGFLYSGRGCAMTPEQRAEAVCSAFFGSYVFSERLTIAAEATLGELVANAVREAVAAERERLLTMLYPHCRVEVARLCDEVFDRSGGLLGRVRDAHIRSGT